MNTKIGTAAPLVNGSLTIGDVAAATGLRASAIRYYEDAGILAKPARVSGKRRYDADTIDRITLIRFCQRLGMSLTDIHGLLANPRGIRERTTGATSSMPSWRRLAP
jgi:MerR family transcriptional regulator, redox-sensitive transcriptional activator SoxR